MEEKSGFSMPEAAKLLATPEGRQLLALLQADGGDTMRRAFAALQRGDSEGAKAILSPVLSDPKAAKLLEQLNGRR